MKQWIAPTIDELNLKETAQDDLGTCHNDFWAGNGMTLEEAKKHNPYYAGGWGGTTEEES